MSLANRWSGQWCVNHPDKMATGAINGEPQCDQCCLKEFGFPKGRLLDAMVAERVMGWSNMSLGHKGDDAYGHDPTCGDLPRDGHGRIKAPAYSTDPAATAEVVKRLQSAYHLQFRLTGYHDDEWFCDLAPFLKEPPYPDQVGAEGHTACEAICRAALKAVA
jgi:hypothetical protein